MDTLFIPVAFIIAASLVMLSSISLHFFWLQAVWVLIGICVLLFFSRVDWRLFLNYRWLIIGLYVFTVCLLVFVYFKGPVIRNTRSWLVLGPFNFQPVELAKISLILLYASYFSKRHMRIAHLKNIAVSFLYFVIPAGLVLLQPDLGSALILFGIWCGFLLVAGLPFRHLAIGCVLLAFLGILMWSWGLKDYQRERILGVFYPERDALGINYSANQSKTAIGSAGFWGKGYKQGSQTQLGFLTESSDDFIFAALIEEWGAVAGFLVVGAFCWIVFRILRIGARADQNFEKFICLGAAIVFGVHFFFNAGSTTGVFPVVGVTFPFLSYGGSSLLINFFILTIINGIAKQS